MSDIKVNPTHVGKYNCQSKHRSILTAIASPINNGTLLPCLQVGKRVILVIKDINITSLSTSEQAKKLNNTS